MFRILIAGNLVMVALTAFRWQNLPPQIPFFFSKPWGEEQLGDTWMLILFPLLMNAIWFINLYLIKRFFSTHPFMTQILRIASIVELIVFVSIFAKIIMFIT